MQSEPWGKDLNGNKMTTVGNIIRKEKENWNEKTNWGNGMNLVKRMREKEGTWDNGNDLNLREIINLKERIT